MPELRILVCGSRSFGDVGLMRERFERFDPNTVVITGGARGADAVARSVARDCGLHVAQVDALWGVFGKSAGPRRNRAMLLLRPDIVLAFRMSGPSLGTDHMVRIARAEGIPVVLWSEGEGWLTEEHDWMKELRKSSATIEEGGVI